MKKLIALLMALTMVVMMAACSTGNNETPATDATETTEAVTVGSDDTTADTDVTTDVTEGTDTEEVTTGDSFGKKAMFQSPLEVAAFIMGIFVIASANIALFAIVRRIVKHFANKN